MQKIRSLIVAFASLAVLPPVLPQSTSFTNFNGAQWNDPANWTNGIPNETLTFVHPASAPLFPFPFTAVIDGINAQAASGFVGLRSGELGRIFIQNGGSLNILGGLLVANMADASVHVLQNSALNIGTGLIITSNSQTATGLVTVSGPGASVSADLINIGSRGSGTLIVEGGAVATASGGQIRLGGISAPEYGTLEVLGTAANRGRVRFSEINSFFGNGHVFVDGGIFQTNRDSTEIFIAPDRLDVRLGENGAIFDPGIFSVATSANLNGTGGITKVGSGALSISDNQTYTGITRVSEGRLNLNGTFNTSEIIVENGATLGGSFNFGGDLTLRSGATLDVGVIAGWVQVGGDLIMEEDSNLILEIFAWGSGGYDQVSGTGTAFLNGHLFLVFPAGFDIEGSGTLLSFSTITGSFASITIVGLDPNFTAHLSEGFLTVAVIPEPASAAALMATFVLLTSFYQRRRTLQSQPGVVVS